ncbi:MAG: flagellar motor switch phosphatase FliY [Lachnospiraceae bacterium]|nr:flagellar motor switch phosphatase FliY [Lachnospiraceae bacterium]
MDGMLSQEEINALLAGMDTSGGSEPEAGTSARVIPNPDEELNDAEKDAVGEISNISMGTAATTLFSLVNQKVNITTPVVTYATWDDLIKNYDRPCVFIQIYYKEGLDGNNILVLKESDVKIITDLMMGGDGTNTAGDLSELHLSAISEAMNQMMGSAATSISSMLEKKVDISPPSAELVDLQDVINGSDVAEFLKGKFVKVSFRMEIGNLINSELMQLYSFDFARDLYRKFVKYTNVDEQEAENVSNQPGAEQQVPQADASQQQAGMPQMGMQGMPGMMPQMMGMPGMMPQMMGMQGMPQMMGMPPQEVNIASAQFQPFMMAGSPLLQTEHIDLLLDVPLEVTVELGRTSKSIKEILDFAPGTIIELSRLAGEPIDVLVNGKYVARGEVVVIEEAFGIRVTEIIKDK